MQSARIILNLKTALLIQAVWIIGLYEIQIEFKERKITSITINYYVFHFRAELFYYKKMTKYKKRKEKKIG